MRLDDYEKQLGRYGGGMPSARRIAGRFLRELGASDATVIYASHIWPATDPEGQPRVTVRLYAALESGFAAIEATADQLHGRDLSVTGRVIAWSTITTLEASASSDADPLRSYQAALVANDLRIESEPNDGADLVALFTEAAAKSARP